MNRRTHFGLDRPSLHTVLAVALWASSCAAGCGNSAAPDRHAAARAGFPCVECHRPDYDTAANPDHVAAGYPVTCADCHSLDAWRPAAFGSHEVFWPLTGAHAVAACQSCHEAGYAGTPRDCVGCHLTQWEQTVDPDHAVAGIPRTCVVCHGTSDWIPAELAGHDDWWPLLGKHADATCESCHKDGYTNTPRACDGCHDALYVATTKPNHGAASFPKTCETCHGFDTWEGATFDHAAKWPLTGAHQDVTCESCHAGGVYAGTAKTCNGCHAADYTETVSPSHTKWALSTACETCHQTTAWKPAEFPESVHNKFFGVTSGGHKEFACADCHKTPSYSDWICVSCHEGEHTLSEMDKKHIGDVSKYPSTMAAAATPDLGCKSCHPTGDKK